MTEIEREFLLNFEALLISSATDRMRYIFTELESKTKFKILVYYNTEPSEIDHESIDDIGTNIIANMKYPLRFSYQYKVDSTTSFDELEKLKFLAFDQNSRQVSN